jgi:hypothetical protein
MDQRPEQQPEAPFVRRPPVWLGVLLAAVLVLLVAGIAFLVVRSWIG